MSTRRTVLVAVIAWVAVVAVGSTLVWTVISRVGENLTAADTGQQRTASAAHSLAPTQPGVQLTRRPHPSQRPSASPTQASSPSPPVGTPIVAPPGTPVSTPTSHPTSEPSSEPTGSSNARRATWRGTGGSVTVVCHGQSISLESAQPDTGFRVEVEDRGPEEIHVKFRGQGDEGRETEMQARCQGGVPAFQDRTDR